MMELFHANKQWSTRPADERFASIRELHDACKAYASTAKENTVEVSNLRTEAIDGDVQIVGRRNNAAKLTHWAFGQLSARVGAPGGYLRDLPATLACQNLNYGLANLADKTDTANLLFHQNGGLLLRAFTSNKYARIWNWEVAERLLQLETQGWKPAMPTINKTAHDFPALYASDHDMFAFVANDSYRIKEEGNPDGLMRGVIVENSEVGASALKLTRFFYRALCSNHIIWGASRVMDISVRHVGDARQRWNGYYAAIKRYADSGVAADEANIASARTVKIGDTKESVLDKLFGMRSLGLTRKVIDAGYEAVIPAQDGDPRTVWGIVQGLTRHSQTVPFADARTTIDVAAGKLMEAAF
jgi:hypothetical protein